MWKMLSCRVMNYIFDTELLSTGLSTTFLPFDFIQCFIIITILFNYLFVNFLFNDQQYLYRLGIWLLRIIYFIIENMLLQLKI